MITTKRLILRRWRAEDVDAFAAINADQKVMEYFPSTYTHQESRAQLKRFNKSIDELGFGFWAAELVDDGRCVGFIGLSSLPKELPFSPCVEIGWRLASDVWRQGLASEGATQVLKYAFNELNLNEIVSVTSVSNVASQGVMQKIGMLRQNLTFMHPRVDPASPLAEHVLFRLSKSDWKKISS